MLDRNFTKFILLTPGTQQLQWQHAASENPQGSTQTMVNGQHFSGTGYQLDGTENRDPILGIIVINPTLESIGETKITSQNYDAEFGQATAGVVSVQTKSGRNQWFGSAFEFHQNDRFQSRNPFTQFQPDPSTGKFLPDTKQEPVRRLAGRQDRREPGVLLRRLSGHAQHGRRLAAADGADGRGPRRRSRAPTASTSSIRPTGVPAVRQQFAGNVIPANRLSPQAQALLRLIPLPERGRPRQRHEGQLRRRPDRRRSRRTRSTCRIDGRINDDMNTFGRYSIGKFFRDGPTAFGAGRRSGTREPGRASRTSRTRASRYGLDNALSSSLLADFRFGWFRYKVNVLPFDFGTTPATDAGIPGLNVDNTFSSGLPAGFVEGDRGFNFGSGLGVNRCNCPLDQDETQWQLVGNVTKMRRQPQLQGRPRHPARQQPPGAERRASLGRVELLAEPHHRTDRRRPWSRHVPARRRHEAAPLRQPEHRRARAAVADGLLRAGHLARRTSKLTLNYGLRLDIINPQTVNEAGNGGFLDLATGEIRVAGVGDIGLNGDVENRLNWAPRVGATYQIDSKTVLRGGYGRSYDLGVFGSLFGHSVTQNLPVLSVQELNAPENFERVFTLAQGPPPPVFPTVPQNGRFPLPDGVFARALPEKQRPPTVDAFNVIVQRQLTDTMSVEVGYVGNRGRNVFAGDGPAINVNQPTLVGYPNVPQNNRKPFFAGGVANDLGLGGAFGWTQGIDFFCNCANNAYDSLQAKFNKRFSGGYSVKMNYTLQRQVQESGDYFFYDVEMNKGPADWDRTHNFVLSLVAEMPVGRDRRYLSSISPVADAFIGGWQFNTNTIIQSGLPFSVNYRDAGADRDTGGNNRPNLTGDPEGPQTRDQWFNATPIGSAGSAFSRPARGTFGDWSGTRCAGPATGGWTRRSSSTSGCRRTSDRSSSALEAVNLFNHVNLGNPDSEVGVPGNNNTNAGRINSTAFFNADPQRNFQFAVRFTF